MIRPSLSLITLFFYSLCLGLSTMLSPFLGLPLLFLAWKHQGRWGIYLKKLLFLNLFIFMVIISLLLNGQYDHALLIFLRSNAVIMMALFLFEGKDAFAVALGVQQLKMPSKISSLFFFTAKFIFLIKEEFCTFRQTLRIRGFQATTSLFTYQTYANFVGMLIIKSLKRAQKLEHSMRLRGFNGELYTLQEASAINRLEKLFMVLLIGALALHLGVCL